MHTVCTRPSLYTRGPGDEASVNHQLVTVVSTVSDLIGDSMNMFGHFANSASEGMNQQDKPLAISDPLKNAS